MSARPPLPNLVVAGVQRAGTTSLHYLLASHPEVFFPERPQEIHFFDDDRAYARGLDAYRRLFRGWRGERWVGQTSPLYLFEPAVPERLHGALPEAKIVVVLREPVSRAYSHYWLEVRYGWERESFERALELEAERLEGGFDARRHFSYTARGRYAEQLERYFALFGRERVLVLLQDEMKNAPERVLERLGGFLDLDPAGFETQGGRVKHRNAALLPRWPALQRWARPIRERLPRFGYVVDGLNLERRSYPPMASGTRAALAERFAPEIDALEALTGVDASAWRTP
ncbi:MAG: sulfotransferase [Acidobacteria bacterium]|nr:sulfotransferase [Acidobacteriota bacterium]